MGQLNHLPRTNVLAFPRARAEESNSSQLQESYGRGHREGAAKRSARLAPQPHGIDDGYLLVPLSGDDKRAILDLLKRPHIVSSSALRFLITAFVLLAVLPSLSLTANLWLDRTDTAPSPAVRVSSNHGSEAIITLPAISIPTTLKAIIGENTPFPIAIGGTDPGEGAGMIVISRLPQDSMFSAGNPDGETTWKLAPGEIDNLHLVLPKTAREDTALLLQLLAPDGHVISDAATIIEVLTSRKQASPFAALELRSYQVIFGISQAGSPRQWMPRPSISLRRGHPSRMLFRYRLGIRAGDS